MRERTSATTRWITAVAALGLASAIASMWRAAPDGPESDDVVINLVPDLVRSAPPVLRLVPPIFTKSSAQGAVAGCTGSANGNFGDNNAAGVLEITMNSIALVDYGANNADDAPTGAGGGTGENADTGVSLLDTPTNLNFAAASGVDVGDFINKPGVPVGTYEAITAEMDDEFRVLCAVTCAAAVPAGTYVTKGGTTVGQAPFDTIGGNAIVSRFDTNGDAAPSPQTFDLPDDSPIEVTEGGIAQKNFKFSAQGACQLYNMGGGNYQILPVTQSAEVE